MKPITTIVAQLAALKMALEAQGILPEGTEIAVIDDAIGALQQQHANIAGWMRANASGGWIDDLRRGRNAFGASPDPNVEALRDLLMQRSLAGFKKYGTTTARTDLSLRDWQLHLLEELLDAAVYLKRQMSYPVTEETWTTESEPAPAVLAYAAAAKGVANGR